MGHPKKPRKKYDTPPHPWDAQRIKEEKKLVKKYGLKNKKEIWKAETMVRRYRREARKLFGMPEEHAKVESKQLMKHLWKLGLLDKDAELRDILDLTVEDVLRRRLQTMVYEKGLARTIKQARQMIVHGYIAIDGTRVRSPGHIVKREEDDKIDFYPHSPMKEIMKSEKEKAEG